MRMTHFYNQQLNYCFILLTRPIQCPMRQIVCLGPAWKLGAGRCDRAIPQPDTLNTRKYTCRFWQTKVATDPKKNYIISLMPLLDCSIPMLTKLPCQYFMLWYTCGPMCQHIKDFFDHIKGLRKVHRKYTLLYPQRTKCRFELQIDHCYYTSTFTPVSLSGHQCTTELAWFFPHYTCYDLHYDVLILYPLNQIPA